MPLGWAGGCQMSRTEVVLTSGKRIPTGGPGTASNNSLSYSKVTARLQHKAIFPWRQVYLESRIVFYHHPVCAPGVGVSWVRRLLCVWSWEPGSRTGHTCLGRSVGHCGWCSPPPSRSGVPNQSLSLCTLPIRDRAETLIHFPWQAALSWKMIKNTRSG